MNKIPKKLGQVVDLLYTSRQKRLDEQHKVDDMKKFETELQEHIIRELPKSEAEGISGKLARAQVVSKEIPVVDDWDKLYAYIKRKNAFDLLNRHLNTAACTERLENGEKIPGIGGFTRVTVSMNKL